MKKRFFVLILVVFLLIFTACGPISSSELRDMSAEYLNALMEGDVDTINALVRSDTTVTKEVIAQYMKDLEADGIVLSRPFELQTQSMSSAAYDSRHGGAHTTNAYILTCGENKYNLLVVYEKVAAGEGISEFILDK